MGKKGQTTLFIILGIILFMGVGYFFIAKYDALPQTEVFPVDLQPAKEYLQYCFQQQLDGAVRTVARYGGYQKPSESVLEYVIPFSSLTLPYAYHNREAHLPSRIEVAESIAAIMRQGVQDCISDQQRITDYTFVIEKPPQVQVEIYAEHVESFIDSSLSIIGEDHRYRADSFTTAVALPLGTMLDLEKQITEIQQQDELYWCISCLAKLDQSIVSIKPEFMAGEGDTTIIYDLVQRENEIPLLFLFAHELPYQKRYRYPELPRIDTLTAAVGQPFIYSLPHWEQEAIYTDNSLLFDIDPFTGYVSFTPTPRQIGKYVTTITMKIPDGSFVQEDFILEVVA